MQNYFNDMYLSVSFMQQIPQRDMWLPSNSDDNPIKSSSGALQVDGLDLQWFCSGLSPIDRWRTKAKCMLGNSTLILLAF